MITTYDQLVAAQNNAAANPFYKAGGTGAIGQFWDYWLSAGNPGAAAAPAAGINGEQITAATPGSLRFVNAASGKQKMLNSLTASLSVSGVAILYDRLWQNSGLSVTTTTAQAMTPVALPNRDEDGSPMGRNVEAWLAITTTMGNAAVNGATITYTNSEGVAGRTGAIVTIPAAAKAGTLIPVTLQSGDVGVRSIEAITLGTSLVSGAMSLVLLRRLAEIPNSTNNSGDYRNFFDIGRKLWDGSALALMSLQSAAASAVLTGQMSVIEG